MQNVEFIGPHGRRIALVDLFRGEAAFVGFWSGSSGWPVLQLDKIAGEIIRLANASAPVLRMLEVDATALGLSTVSDAAGKLAAVLGLASGTPMFCLLRPDMHLAARIEQPTAAKVKTALQRALREGL